MVTNTEPSRKPTSKSLLEMDPAARLEALEALEEHTRVELLEQLSPEAVLEILAMKNAQAILRDRVVEEADRRSKLQIPSDDAMLSLDARARAALLNSLGRKERISILKRMPSKFFGDILAQEMVDGLNYNSTISHFEYLMPSIDDLLDLEPRARAAVLRMQKQEKQVELLAQLPASSKAEMLHQKYLDALNLNVVAELDSRDG